MLGQTPFAGIFSTGQSTAQAITASAAQLVITGGTAMPSTSDRSGKPDCKADPTNNRLIFNSPGIYLVNLDLVGTSASALQTTIQLRKNTLTAIPGIGVTQYKDLAVDAQYQYLSDPHTLTAQARYVHESINDSSGTAYAGNSTLNSLMLKTSYVYQDKYGASFSFRNISGSADASAYSSSANLLPNSRIWTPEVFWMPVQNMRLGIQYNYFSKYFGSSSNYDGNGRNAGDNNSLFLYVWAAM